MDIEEIKQFLLGAFAFVTLGVATYCLAEIRDRLKKIEKHLGIEDEKDIQK